MLCQCDCLKMLKVLINSSVQMAVHSQRLTKFSVNISTSLSNPNHLRQSSDWPAHGLVSDVDESHGDILHAHL